MTTQEHRPWKGRFVIGKGVLQDRPRHYQLLLKGRPWEIAFFTSTIIIQFTSYMKRPFTNHTRSLRAWRCLVSWFVVAWSECNTKSLFTWCVGWSLICMLTLWSSLALEICPIAFRNSLVFSKCLKESPDLIRLGKTERISRKRARVWYRGRGLFVISDIDVSLYLCLPSTVGNWDYQLC